VWTYPCGVACCPSQPSYRARSPLSARPTERSPTATGWTTLICGGLRLWPTSWRRRAVDGQRQTTKEKAGPQRSENPPPPRVGERPLARRRPRSWSRDLPCGTSPKKSGGDSKPKTKPSANYLLTEGRWCRVFQSQLRRIGPGHSRRGATPVRTTPTYHRVNRKSGTIGTFYLALTLDSP
jgi:hypothetical protein